MKNLCELCSSSQKLSFWAENSEFSGNIKARLSFITLVKDLLRQAGKRRVYVRFFRNPQRL
jgi:hypothetical protein